MVKTVIFRWWIAVLWWALGGWAVLGRGQSNPIAGTPAASWNSYLVAMPSMPILLPTATAPVFGTPLVPTTPAEVTMPLSALPAGTTSAVIATAGTDVAGNTYQLLALFGDPLSLAAIAKTTPAGISSYIRIPFGRPGTFVRTDTAFYFTYGTANFPKVYRVNPDGTFAIAIDGPSVTYHLSTFLAPTIEANDTVTYTVVEPAVGAGNIGARNVFAAVGAVPYLQPALASTTPVALAPAPTLSLSTNVYSSLPISYQWSYNGAAISGANQSSYGGPFLGPGTYSVLATTAGGTVSTSTQVQLTVGGVVVGATPVFLTNPVSAKVVLGSSLTLRATAAATSSVSLQWALDGVPLAGANTTTASTVNYGAYDTSLTVTQPGTYSVIATTTGTNGGSVTSTGATVQVLTTSGVTVLPTPTILAQPTSVNALYANGVVTPTGLSVTAVATLPTSYQWFFDGAAIVGATESSYSATRPGSYTVAVSTSAGNVTSQAAVVTAVTSQGVTVLDTPQITAQPQGTNLVFGTGANLPALGVTAVALQPMSYQWLLNGAPIAGATSPTHQATTAGTYTVVVTTDAGAVTSASAVVSLANRLANISGRFQVGAGANIGIAGFVVASYSGAPKPILIRGVGPSLNQFGVSGLLARPVLSVFDSKGRLVASNSGWDGSPDITAAGVAAGAFPLVTGSADAALVLNLPPGAYTAQIAGAGGSVGVALAEIYESVSDAGQLVNISERALVGTGAHILISGFVTKGSLPSKVLVRGVGPGLAQFGLNGALVQPVLSVYDSRGTLIGVNTGWSAGGSADAVAINNAAGSVGAFLLQPGSNDCAILLSLPPGAYTAQVSGANGSIGLALVEVYQIPP